MFFSVIGLRRALWIGLLYLPVVLFYAAHFSTSRPDAHPTGFVQYDMPYYMANAREYADGGTDGVRYALPFSSDRNNAPIYFQPQVFALGWVWRITGFDPGLLFVLFGAVFGLLCISNCLRVLREVVPSSTAIRPLIDVLFIWGGGVFCIAGLGYGVAKGLPSQEAWATAFRFDPEGGWWFMNLGRNLIYPFEAYYHFLFFTLVLCLIRGRYRLALVLSAFLAISHPFTGVATLLMVTLWSANERWYIRSSDQPRWYFPGSLLLLAATLAYYGWLLPQDAEHRILMEQWKVAWVEKAVNFIPAYVFVAVLAVLHVRSPERLRTFLSRSTGRLFFIWALTWFLLENHEFAVEAHQPLHFSRGYTWAALFLIGAPALDTVMDRLGKRWLRPVAVSLVVLLSSLFLFDNGSWMAREAQTGYAGTSQAFLLTADQRALYSELSIPMIGEPLLICEDPDLAYLAMVYTPLRSYCSHAFNTPSAQLRRSASKAFFEGRITDPLLQGDLLVVVGGRQLSFNGASDAEFVFANSSYTVFRRRAIAGAVGR